MDCIDQITRLQQSVDVLSCQVSGLTKLVRNSANSAKIRLGVLEKIIRKIDLKSDQSRKSAMIAVYIAEQAKEATEAVLDDVEEIVGAIENNKSDPEFVLPDEFIENETSGQVDQNDEVIVISSDDESETSFGL